MNRALKKKLGMLKTKRCSRCHEYFYPNTPRAKRCPYCVGKNYPLSKHKCRIWDCENLVGKGKNGLCLSHYIKLVRNPKIKMQRALKRTGYKICQTYLKCEVFFVPKDKLHWGVQKYCPNCQKTRLHQGIVRKYLLKREKNEEQKTGENK